MDEETHSRNSTQSSRSNKSNPSHGQGVKPSPIALDDVHSKNLQKKHQEKPLAQKPSPRTVHPESSPRLSRTSKNPSLYRKRSLRSITPRTPRSTRNSARPLSSRTSEPEVVETETLNAFSPLDPAFAQVNLEPLDTTYQLCVETLEEGFIDSFIELFTLSHREPVLIDPVAEEYFSIPPTKLKSIKRHLVQAERARHDLKFEEGSQAYQWLADYFEENDDKETSLFFHQKNLEHVQMSSDSQLEAEAYESMAFAYERLGEMTRAIDFLEKKLYLAENDSESPHVKKEAEKKLMGVYMKFAENLRQQGEIKKSMLFYDKCVDQARSCEDSKTEGEVSHKQAEIHQMLGDTHKAIESEMQYLGAAERSDNQKGVISAYMSLADHYEHLNDNPKATQYLERCMEMAEKETDEQDTVRQVCERLGVMYDKMKDYENSVKFLERSYELEKAYGGSDDVNRIGVQLGMARGNRDMNRVMENITKEQ
eukprot:gb/GECH01000477.1/.p1 GENE.gb/GECH01000477.1/~~gb/GECH01000477.1/.p1  ORF type:complete len:481 (+),score=118.41 gb/GECH01000477.1/:1-1443(+)